MDRRNFLNLGAGALLTSLIVKSNTSFSLPKKVKDIDQSDFAGEIERISNNYVMYSGWFKNDD
jgi:hypothetical protein